MKFILASSSPRRQQMLKDLGVVFTIESPQTDEKKKPGEPPIMYVRRVAREKAESISRKSHSGNFVILSADTIVVYRNQIMGKPRNSAHALKMLKKLSGKTHEVITAFVWMGNHNGKSRIRVESVRTKVKFTERNLDFWKWYVSTKEPMDKAGAYAAQGIGMSFIESVSGSYANVVGLPLAHVLKSYKDLFGANLYEHFGKFKKN